MIILTPSSETSEPAPQSDLRLNPFAFPSNTDFLFVLLIVFTLCLSLAAFHIISLQSPIYHDPYFDGLKLCQERFLPLQLPGLSVVNAAVDANDANALRQLEQTQAALQLRLACTRPLQLGLLARTLALTVALFGVAGLVYWLWPRWLMWRGKLQPLAEDDAPDLPNFLQQCCAEVGLVRSPQFVWNPLNQTRAAQAFGNARQPFVALSGGLVSEFYADRAAFRAVVLHELSHHKNADVTKTYFSMALWYAFIILAALPRFLVLLIWGSRSLDAVFSVVWQLGVVTALSLGLRNSILRQREHYADVRATTLEDTNPALLRELQREAHMPPIGWRTAFIWWRVHPSVGLRQKIMHDTRSLFLTSAALAFATGLVTSAVLRTPELVIGLYADTVEAYAQTLALPVSLVLVGILGLGAWRTAFLTLMSQRTEQPIWQQALAFGIGLFLGEMALLPDMQIVRLLESPSRWFASTLDELLGAAVLAVLAWVVVSWLVDVASLWLGIAARRRSPRATYLLLLMLAVVVVIPLAYITLVSWRIALASGRQLATTRLAQDFVEKPSSLLTLIYITLGLLPAAYLLWRNRARFAGEASWSLLSPAALTQPNQPDLGPLPQIQPRIVLRYAWVGACAVGLLQMALRLIDLFFIRGTSWDNETFGTVYLAVLRVGALLQAVFAILAARRAKAVPVIHALLVVFISGVLLMLLFVVWRAATQGLASVTSDALIGNLQVNISYAALPAMLGCWLFLRRRPA